MTKHAWILLVVVGAFKVFAATGASRVILTNQPVWKDSAGAGITLTRGNSDTLLFTANVQAAKKTAVDEISLGADGGYGENGSVENVNDIHGFSQANHLFDKNAFVYLRLDALHDEIADLHYRVTLSPGAGYYFLQQTNTTLAGECGPAMVFEHLDSEERNYVSARLAERFEHKFSGEHARVWQKVEFLPQVNDVNDFNNYIINAEIGIESAISKKISLQISLQDNFINDPAPGREQNDLKIVNGLKYKF